MADRTPPNPRASAEQLASRIVSEVSGHAYREGCDGCDARYTIILPMLTEFQCQRERQVWAEAAKVAMDEAEKPTHGGHDLTCHEEIAVEFQRRTQGKEPI